MSHYDADSLYELVPSVYRQRDAERGYPLRDLVAVLAAQAQVSARDIERLQDNSFIETCDEWVVPYIGDLLGVRGLRPDRATSARAEVANTISYRRRKGTASVLEQLARDVTGWPARVVEFFELLAASQFITNHVRLHAPATARIRESELMELVDTALDVTAHSVDVRRIEPREGRHNIPHVGLCLFRLQAIPQLLTEPHVVDAGNGHYAFSPLGHDMPLFTDPESETGTASIAEEHHLPVAIRRRALHADLGDGSAGGRYVGKGLSLGLFEVSGGDWQPLPGPYVACDLGDWNRALPPGVVAIDPVLGRLRFAVPADAPEGFRVSSHMGFPQLMAGGQYDRAGEVSVTAPAHHLWVGDAGDPELIANPDIDTTSARFFDTVSDAIVQAQNGWNAPETHFIEIVDSRTYRENLPTVTIPPGGRLVLRAADGCRPTVMLGADLEIEGEADSSVELDGLWIAGGAVVVKELAGPVGLDELKLSHITLVPGGVLQEDGSPVTPGAVSLAVEPNSTEVTISKSILGGLRTAPEAAVAISDSVVDVHDPVGEVAFGGLAGGPAHGGPLTVVRCTIIGRIDTAELTLGEDSLFLGVVIAERRQRGCVRYSWVARGSRVPRRYRCQPVIPGGSTDHEAQRIASRLAPRFVSRSYGRPDYCQLHWHGPVEILRGASTGAEMGVYADLQQPQREDDLRLRLDEYLPVGLEAGILFAT